jgi:hypothetical protein
MVNGLMVEELEMFPTVRESREGKPSNASVVEEVFAFYVSVLWTGRGVKPVLSDKRSKLIARALKDYSVDVLKQAVVGCSLSDWHMGGNPRNTRYTSLELILRDAEHIERFASIAEDADSAGGFLNDSEPF